MTIEEMRSAMREKVVPEEVVPQNVINCLIDDDAQPPKLDAFAFLTRLRALGIGSADFLNLLQGCGAPQSVIERIKQNPAMNLQGLVMTLENSELDTEDYTRMLLTARQVWERTLTMRLEKSEKLSRNIEQFDEPELEPETVETSPVIEEFDDYDEDMCEMSFTAVFDRISEEMRTEADNQQLSDDNLHSGKNAKRIFEQARRDRDKEERYDALKYDEQAEDGSFKWLAGEEPEIPEEPADKDIEINGCVVPEMSAEDYQTNAAADDEPFAETTEDMTTTEGFDSSDSDELSELTFTQAFDKIKSKKSEPTADNDRVAEDSEEQSADKPEDNEKSAVSDTTSLVQIDEAMLRENFEKLAEKAHKEKEEKEKAEKARKAKAEKEKKAALDKAGLADKQNSAEKTAKQSSAKAKKPKERSEDEERGKKSAESNYETAEEREIGEVSEANEVSEADETAENTVSDEERGGKVYHKRAIASAAVGAAALMCAGYMIGARVGKNDAKFLHYAKDNSEIFNKIYEAYSDNVSGGSAAGEVDQGGVALFGDLLLSDGDGVKSIGNFALNTDVYSITEEAVSASIINNGVIIPCEDIAPPENSRFVAAFDNNGELYALFSGKRSGFVKIRSGMEDYTVLQDGVLTDYDFSDGQIKLGTVYTPIFERTFTLNDENVYLPKTGVEIAGEERVESVPAKNIIMSSAKGYSYGVSAGYSTDSGKTSDVVAVMGDPVAAAADGRFALNGNEGLLLKTENEKFSAQKSGLMSRAAFGKSGCAIAEKDAAGKVKIFGEDLKLASMLTGVSEKIGGMWFNEDVLTVTDESDGILRVDCADVGAPEPLSLKMANGLISGNSALTYQTENGKLTITRSDFKNGVCEKHSEYTKELSEEQLKSVKLGDSRAVLTDGDATGVSYSYFDGVSVISEYVVFAKDGQPKTVSVFDDKTGFTAAFKMGGEINAVCAGGVKVPK